MTSYYILSIIIIVSILLNAFHKLSLIFFIAKKTI